MLAIYVVSLYFYLCYENQFQFPRRRIRLHNLNVSWDMTFGCVYPKDYIASWTLVVAPCKYLLAFFWLIMSWHVGFSTAPIANPFTFSFPNTSWNNFRCWAEYIVISLSCFLQPQFLFFLIFFTDFFPKSAHKVSTTIGGGTIPTSGRESKQLNQ